MIETEEGVWTGRGVVVAVVQEAEESEPALSRVQVVEMHGLKIGGIWSHLPTKPSLTTLWGAPVVSVPRAPRSQSNMIHLLSLVPWAQHRTGSVTLR